MSAGTQDCMELDELERHLRGRFGAVQSKLGRLRPVSIPDSPDPDRKGDLALFLTVFDDFYARLRYHFQYTEVQSNPVWDESQIVSRSQELEHLVSGLAANCMSPSRKCEYELLRMVSLDNADVYVSILTAVYKVFRQNLRSYRFLCAGSATRAADAVLGWSRFARSSLPIAEAALLLERRSDELLGAKLTHFWQSHILHALTVSPGQGQSEWLALVADTLAPKITHLKDLEWYHHVVSYRSEAFPGSQSLVIDEIVMTDSTNDTPNELYSLLNTTFGPATLVETTYEARRELADWRRKATTPRSLQIGATARAMLNIIRCALRCTEHDRQRSLYEKWIVSEWDAPSIFFNFNEIRTILEDLDKGIMKRYISDWTLRTLVVNHRGLKAVCARARSLARKTMNALLPFSAQIKTPQDFDERDPRVVDYNRRLAALESRVADLDTRIAEEAQKIHFERFQIAANSTFNGLVFEANRIVGTNAEECERPRRLWDLVFNSTIESAYTTLPWMAVSHSWAQAAGSFRCSINGRANIIPWATQSDLKNVRKAVMRAGFTMAWMDKICLRQRGIDGFDSATRLLEWDTDIPFIDIAYTKAAKILVYLEGAGRPLSYQSTFSRGRSWFHRKWTAQETPAGIEIVLGSGDQCVMGDFFDLCKDASEVWHEIHHKGLLGTTQSCKECGNVRERIDNVRALRNLPDNVPESDRLRHVWNVVRDRAAGCEADHFFSLLSLLRVARRPKYDPKFTRTQASSLIRQHLLPETLAAITSNQNETWFDGAFHSDLQGSAQKIRSQFAAFLSSNSDSAQCPEPPSRYSLQGFLSGQGTVMLDCAGKVLSIARKPNVRKCACLAAGKQLKIDRVDVYSSFYIWHGREICCAVISDIQDPNVEETPLKNASHLLLSDNGLLCLPLIETPSVGNDQSLYRVNRKGESLTFRATPEWTVTKSGVQSRKLHVQVDSILGM